MASFFCAFILLSGESNAKITSCTRIQNNSLYTNNALLNYKLIKHTCFSISFNQLFSKTECVIHCKNLRHYYTLILLGRLTEGNGYVV